MRHINGKPDPLDFPAPDAWATFVPMRSPQFKTHKHLSQAKNALSGKMQYQARGGVLSAPSDMWVYEWDVEEQRWVERYEILRGSTKEAHPLWTSKVKAKKARADVPQTVVDKTIASILKSVPPPQHHKGANAEDCPACSLTPFHEKLAYPFICPGGS